MRLPVTEIFEINWRSSTKQPLTIAQMFNRHCILIYETTSSLFMMLFIAVIGLTYRNRPKYT